jgi:hypothetical protein
MLFAYPLGAQTNVVFRNERKFSPLLVLFQAAG